MFWDRRAVIDAIVTLGSTLAIFVAIVVMAIEPRTTEHSFSAHAPALFGLFFALAAFAFAGWRMWDSARLRQQAEVKLQKLAHTDALTGVMNRSCFETELSEELGAVAADPERRAAVLVLDLKGFKPVNDLFGEAASDQLLVEFAGRVRTLLPDHIVFARMRGDIFAIMLPALVSKVEPDMLAQTIIDALHTPLRAGNAEHLIGVAIGIAMAPSDAQTTDDLLVRAGHAVRRARDLGHWAFCFFEPGMAAELDEKLRIERALPAAIAAGELEPYYQPIVDLESANLLAFEALARWTHPTLGPVSPGKFIPIAEDVGLIRPLTDHLFRRACSDAAKWPSHIGLSFNISPKELQNASLGRALLAIMAESGMPAARLQIELTESAVLRDMQAAREVLTTLREAGVTIALDDFGTGRASLAHLRELKIDALKVDGSFVQNQSPESVMILEAILAIAQRLELSVTAEGVETEGQRAALIARGCPRGQGYLFGRPVAASQLASILDRSSEGTLRQAAARPFRVLEMR